MRPTDSASRARVTTTSATKSGLNQTAAALLLLVGQLLELVPGPIEADPMRDHTVDPNPVTVGPVGHAGGEADQSGFGGTVRAPSRDRPPAS
jgi:hypothetical protein